MMAGKGNILLTLIYQGDNYQIQTYANEYHDLMTLISHHLAIGGFGLCCGMGSCGTCMVQISDKYSSVARHVLACDIKINDELSNTQIAIERSRY